MSIRRKDKTLCVLGPYDRYNYGDLIFPFIIEHYLGCKYKDIEYFATIDSDMSEYGGKRSLCSNKIRDYKNCDIVVAGGESVGASWGILASYIHPSVSKPLNYIKRIPKYGTLLMNIAGRMVMRGVSWMPLTVTKGDFPNADKIFYNSLGGSLPQVLRSRKFELEFAQIDHIAVRDNFSVESLRGIYPNIFLAPDSAILMSEVFPIQRLRGMVSEDVARLSQEDYFVFQVSRHIGMANLDEIEAELRALCESSQRRVVLCTIGYAPGHEDYVPLRVLKARLGDRATLMDRHTIWDIMLAIANSKLYIGTSLHGVITSMSYRVPYVGLDIPKVNRYISTWGCESICRTYKISEIRDSEELMLTSRSKELNESYEYQKRVILDSFSRME